MLSSVKESPPRSHSRGSNSPRPLGEIIDEAEAESSPGSPALRHPKGRLESNSSRETYAGAVKDHSPSRNGLPNGNGMGMPARTNSPSLRHVSNGSVRRINGGDANVGSNGGDANGGSNGNRNGASNEDGRRTPETFDGVGEDEEPRSPIRKVHKRTSSRQIKEKEKEKDSTKEVVEKTTNGDGKGKDGTPEEKLEPGTLVYENLKNKSGENLASVKPFEGYDLSLQQRENKKSSSSPSQQLDRKDKDSDLVSGRRVGEGWARSAIRWAPLNVPLQRRLQTLVVLMHTLSVAGGLALFLFLCAIPILWPIVIPYLLYTILSRASVDGRLAQRSEWCRRSKIWSLFGSYFPARLHRSQELEPTRKYIFGYHPHGIISHGAFAAFATEALGFRQLFPGITNTLLTLDTNFKIPLYREYALRMGLASVSRESCENLLSKGGRNGEGMGRAITIVVGGARESLDALPYTLRLVLKRRKGFVKLGIRQGADLVPVLAFGENDIYDQFDTEAHPWIHKGQMVVKKLMGFTVSWIGELWYLQIHLAYIN